MKVSHKVLAIAAAIAVSPAALAASWSAEAPVVDVKPVYQTIEGTKTDCRIETITSTEKVRTELRSGYVDYIDRPVTRDVERCRTTAQNKHVQVGYDVRYSYGGQEFTKRMTEHPGNTVTVQVDVTSPQG